MSDHRAVFDAFGFPPEAAAASLYPWAPVYRLERAERSGVIRAWVVKRTRAGGGVAAWTRSLAAAGAPVVAPAPGFAPNPRPLPTGDEGAEQSWVVYPFIDGDPYRGEPSQIRAGGALLGLLHALGAQAAPGLPLQERAVETSPADAQRDADTICQALTRYAPDRLPAARDLLAQRRERYFGGAAERLRGAALPLVDGSWDYKASNLVYAAPDRPWLIDPDGAGRLPRLYDLAIAALLFHNDPPMHRAPRRPFAAEEWAAFLAGYTAYVALTRDERARWSDVLLAAWMDEALWLLGDHAEGWADPDQRDWLIALLTLDLDTLAT